jgi:ABC-2 type transport system permease protein
MQAYWTLVRRELGGHFNAWTGYVVIAAVLFLMGLSFVQMLQALNAEPVVVPVTEMFYDSYSFWLILLLASPIITMRCFALEKSSGTIETLMTAPVGDVQVVLAKFTGAWLFYGLLWLPLLGCILIVRHYARDPTLLDGGALVATFTGILLLGALYLSLGCLASSLTQSQIIAAMICLAVGIALFLLSFLHYAVPVGSGWQGQVMAHISLVEHMRDFARGVVDTRHVIYYVTGTVLFLFLTLKVVESRRWK